MLISIQKTESLVPIYELSCQAAHPGSLVVWPEGSVPDYIPADIGRVGRAGRARPSGTPSRESTRSSGGSPAGLVDQGGSAEGCSSFDLPRVTAYSQDPRRR